MPFKATKSLVIGDSLIRDFEPKDSSKLEIKSISGANISVIKSTLEKLENDGKKYHTVYLIIGTNDCANRQATSHTITNDTAELFAQAKKIADHIVYSSIIPRTDDNSAKLKVETANPALKTLCGQYNVKYVDNDGLFYTADRSPNDALLLDGLHLNDKGSAKLIENLNLDATPRKRRPKQATQYYQTRNQITPLLSKNAPNNRQQYNQMSNSWFPPNTLRYHSSRRFPADNTTYQTPSHNPKDPRNIQWNQQPLRWDQLHQQQNWNQSTAWCNQRPDQWPIGTTQLGNDFSAVRYCTSCYQQGHSAQNCSLGWKNNNIMNSMSQTPYNV